MTKHRHNKNKPAILDSRFWTTHVSLLLLRLAVLLPYKLQLSLGKKIGNMMYHVMKKRRHVAETNIKLCFPHLAKDQQDKIVRSTFQSFYISLFETAITWWQDIRDYSFKCDVDGIENLEQAVKKGNGVLLLTGHFTCVDLGGAIMKLYQPISAVYKRHRNPFFEQHLRRFRQGIVEQAIQHHNMRELIKTLKQGRVCWYAPDQDFGRRQSVFAQFMGIEAATLNATARIAKISGASVVPFFPRRYNDGSGYRLTILPALENFPSDDEIQDASLINKIIEEQVLIAPDQYLWLHRRFKTRPKGKPKLYGFAERYEEKKTGDNKTNSSAA